MNYNIVMKKFLKATTVIAASALVFACSCSIGSGLKNYGENFYAMGTVGTLITALPDNAKAEREFEAFADEVRELLNSADNSLSATITTSSIYKFNQAKAGETIDIDKTAYEVLSKAKEIYTLTEGYYNPAVYYNVLEYGFPLDKDNVPTTLPDENTVLAFCDLATRFEEVELTEKDGKYCVKKPDYTVTVDEITYSLAIDLGGIGKGWCADKVSALMQERGYNYGMFNFSSSSIALKSYAFNKSGNYSLEPRDPRVAQGVITSFCAIDIKDCNLSTSGDYEKFYEIDGVRYCHIIDPFTGSPIQTGVASVTVIGGSATEDDAYTTALACMGKERAVRFINEYLSDRFVVMLVFEDGAGKIITNRPNEIKINNTQYELANSVENGRIILNVA